MATPKIARNIAQVWLLSIRSAHLLDKHTNGWPGMLAGAARQALKPDSVITGQT
jgi:hypothetical protein